MLNAAPLNAVVINGEVATNSLAGAAAAISTASGSLTTDATRRATIGGVIAGITPSGSRLDAVANTVVATFGGYLGQLLSNGPPIPAPMTGEFIASGSQGGIIQGVIRGLVADEGAWVAASQVVAQATIGGVIQGLRGANHRAAIAGQIKGFTGAITAIAKSYAAELAALSRTPSTVVVITLDHCQRTFGTAPCNASGAPCFNTFATCKYPTAYDKGSRDYTFCLTATPVDLAGRITRPYLKDAKIAALEILAAENLIVNQKADLKFADEPDGDYGVDPYRVSDPLRQSGVHTETVTTSGTFWRKLLRRNRHYKGRRVTIWHGFDVPNATLDDYREEFRGVLDNIAIAADGTVTVTVKGLLQLTELEIPRKTDGKLWVPISDTADTLQLAPWSGVDLTTVPYSSKYAASGLLKIGKELIAYTGLSLDQSTGVTTFTGCARGQHNAYGWDLPQAHNAEDEVTQAEFHTGNPADLMVELLRRAGIADADIDMPAFARIREEHLTSVVFAAVVHEPTKIKELLAELREQTLTHIWQDEHQRITARFMAPIYPWQTYRRIGDEANIVLKSTNFTMQEDKRITRAVIHYDHMAGEALEADKFWRSTEYRDSDAEADVGYAEVKNRKPVLSRWVWKRHGGDDYTLALAGRLVELFRAGAPEIRFDLELKDSTLALGEIFEIESARLVDQHGQAEVARYMVAKRERVKRGVYRYTAVDTGLDLRYLFIAPDDHPTEWSGATSQQQAYGCISSDIGRAPDSQPGYKII